MNSVVEMVYKIYILYSKKYLRTYVGFSGDLTARLIRHNSGQVASTKRYRPWQLIYEEEIEGYKEARKRELYFKSGAGRRKIKLIFDTLKLNQETCPSG